MTKTMIEQVKAGMGETLIPGSAAIPAAMVMSPELLDRLAVSAISAMRKPTEAMVEAASDSSLNGGHTFKDEYTAAIDAALKETL